jgi:hypothetical protein
LNVSQNPSQEKTLKKLTTITLTLILSFLLLPCSSYSDCIDGDCQNGQGTITYSDGGKYVGEWKDGKRNGQGTMTLSDGQKYVGEWKDGKINDKEVGNLP